MYAETINTGVAAGRSFQDSFGKEADGNLDEVRRTFLLKAFQRRQEALLLHLAEQGLSPDDDHRARASRDLDAQCAATSRAAGWSTRYLQRRARSPDRLVRGRAGLRDLGGRPRSPLEGYDSYVNGLRPRAHQRRVQRRLCAAGFSRCGSTCPGRRSRSPRSPDCAARSGAGAPGGQHIGGSRAHPGNETGANGDPIETTITDHTTRPIEADRTPPMPPTIIATKIANSEESPCPR